MTKKKGTLLYAYETHEEIPPYMRDYLLEVSGARRLQDIAVKSINDFLNGLEQWQEDILPKFNKKMN
jgi:hypothetical protein